MQDAALVFSGSKPALPQTTPGTVSFQFFEWLREYLAAAPAQRDALLNQGVRLAQARRVEYKHLIVEDPRRALEQAVPMVVRQDLPPGIVDQLEERVNLRGDLHVYQGSPSPDSPPPTTTLTHRIATFQDGRSYVANVYGRRAQDFLGTRNDALNGVAVDNQFAVNEDPIRVLEAGERPSATKQVTTRCPISGIQVIPPNKASSPVPADTTAVETPEHIVYLCGGYHRDSFQTLLYAEGGTGGPIPLNGILPASPTPSVGILKVLYIPMTFQDQNKTQTTESKAYEIMRDVADFYAKGSYGKLTLIATVTPSVIVPHSEAWYTQKDTSNGGTIDGLGLEFTNAKEEAKKIGFDWSDYDCVVVRLSGGPRSSGVGGYGGGAQVWLYFDSVTIAGHEIGHTFGLSHANFWDTSGTSAIGAGTNQEYGDQYDIMGGGSTPTDHYNAQAKNQIKWLPDSYVRTISQSGTYRVYAMDQPTLDPANSYAVKIVKDSQRTYWGEVRQLYNGSASRPWADKGMLLGWTFTGGANGSNIQLIDTTPGSQFAKDDAAISLGRTFSDFESGIHITTTNVSSTTPKYVDIVVNFGQFPGNQPPTLSLTSSADYVPVGATVTFTATATDPDGDTLAYSWQNFGDTSVKIVSPNSSVITRTFSTAGTYIVSCTVSDMKGGSTTQNKLITVGSGNSRYNISGRVTAGGIGLPNVIITANGANAVVTDNSGNYTIPNLTATTYSMTPLLYGYTFSETFNNSVTVGPNFTGADFVAQATPVVTIAATVPNAQEPGTGTPVVNGQFTLTRTGDTTQPLTVYVNSASGTATKNTDYTFSPDYVSATQGFSIFTIPADSATLDIVVTPLSDTAAEGPETVILQLGPGSGYLVGTASTATVTITDDPLDTTLPKVSLVANNSKTIENSGVPGTMTFTRTGATTNALTVNYSVSGTATPGSDYTTLPGTITIPAGSSSTVLNVMPIDDTVSEPLETVIVTTAASSNYIVESVASTATISIVDDDVQIVNVVASDPTAKEVDLSVPGAQPDTGTFLITRTGDTTNSLTVYYALSGPTTSSMALNGVDFEALSGVVTIPAGASSAVVTIVPRYDGLGEGREYVTLQLGAGPTNYQLGPNNNATISIDDAATDVPYVEVISLANASEPSTSGTFRISVKGSGTGTLTINYTVGGTAVAGTDYTSIGTSTTITLANGTVTKDITVTPINNAVANELRTITLSLNASPNYQTFAPSSTATMYLLDDEQPTVFVDANSTTTPPSITEGGTAGTFYISRTGSTTNALAVNFALSGTAVNGVDYTASSSTSATIPAGASGVDVTLTPTNDSVFEGTRTIILTLASGAYGRGPTATMYLNDNETSTQKVAFTNASGSGSESTTTVNIPVSLTSAATAPVTVEYVVDTGARTSSSSTVSNSPTLTIPYWVRVVRSGTTFTNYASTDGVNWLQRGPPQTIGMSSTGYIAGIVAASGSSGTSSSASFTNFTVTGLDPGGSAGSAVSADIGSPNPVGSDTLTSGTYSLTAGGPDIATSTTDSFHTVYFPITNSANCTITARLTSVAGANAASKGGVMIRESTANNAVHSSTITLKDSSLRQTCRLTTGASGVVNTSTTKPWWVRLQRAGDVFSSFTSPDGVSWTQLGTNQTMALSSEVLAGLAVSARSDGLLSTATFDNVTLTGSPVLQGRTIGFVNAQGTDSLNAGVYTVTGSGAQIGSTGDECHFVAAPVTGDFTLTARVLSQDGGAVNAQAGVMVRELPDFRARSLYVGLVANAGSEFIFRNTTVTTANGDGVDFSLPPGTLTFNVGDITKNIPLTIINDTIPEPDEQITILLRNANGAQLGTQTTFIYTIIDDDSPPVLPGVGFASTAVSATENSGTANVLVALSVPSTSSVTVDYSVTAGTATAGSDFTASAGTLTFAPGETVKSIPVTLLDDALVESSETVLLTLSNPGGAVLSAQNTATLTILDDDTPTVSVVATTPNATEAGTPGVFTFTRAGSLSGALTVNFTRSGTATSGTDYTAIATPGTIIIPNGQASATLNVTPIQDSLNEGTETVIITLASGSYTIGTSNTATVNILDDDRSTVNITATIPNASETAGHPGQFTITRTAPTTSSLTVNLAISGTATNGTDYTTISTTATIAAGQTSVTIAVSPIDDSITEGPESVVLSLASGSYDIGANSFASVIIADNDSPPTLFISSPTAQGPLIASGNGLIVGCTVTDDGAPQPVTLLWSQVSGPGTATFATPTAAISPVSFSADGVYVLKVTATDGQFTVTDQVTVIVGSSEPPADWMAQDMSPSVSLRGQSLFMNNTYTLTGTGAGYASTTTDGAHVMVKQITGDGTVIARLDSLTGATTPLAGITIRDTLFRGATRAVLGYVPGTGLQYRTRTTINATDSVTTQAAVALPVWLKLSRSSATNVITASYASDVSGAPGTWNVISAPVVTMDNNAEYGLTTTSNSTSLSTVAVLDNVSLSPAPAGAAMMTEDIGSANALPGSYSYNAGTHTISASGSLDSSGYFVAQQYYGDLMVTAKLTSANSGSPNAHAGIMIRESMDSGGYAFIGRNPTGAFNGYIWRTLANGSTGGIPTFTGTTRWIRLIRRGNSISAFHAADVSGAPGAWTQLGQPQTIIMTTPVLVGLAVDNAGLSTLNTATFTDLSIVPLNKAPIVNAGNFGSSVVMPVNLTGSVTDDSFPTPPSLTTQWSAIAGPGTANFGNTAATSTSVTFSVEGTYTLRLRASDGSAETFNDVTLTAYATPFAQWQGANFAGGSSNPAAGPLADPDGDGIINLLEYAFATSPNGRNASPLTLDTETVAGNQYLRLTVPKNAAATDLLYQVEAASNLTNPIGWSSSGLIIETNTSTTLRVRDNVPFNGGSSIKRFMHVLVSKP